jgi:glycosyltransferase involved in cell wall biosynthesis
MVNTLEALAAAGHHVDLVSPYDSRSEDSAEIAAALRPLCEPHLVPATRLRIARALLHSRRAGVPLSIGRHALTAVRDEVGRLCAAHRFHVVHAEQLHALPQCAPARRHALPIVLRSQNVETDLWSALAAARPALTWLAGLQARRLGRYEGDAVRTVAATVALTGRDAERLRGLSGGAGLVRHVAAPFPERLPPGPDAIEGSPAVVMLGTGWWPGRDGTAWFLAHAWPEVRARCPDAILHVFGPGRLAGRARGVTVHSELAHSAEAFPRQAILAVALRVASGVRMKILEAWARGVPVVATPEAVAGLDATDGQEYLVAENARQFAAAVERVHRDGALARRLVAAGRAVLKARHDPRHIARELGAVYADVAHPGGQA